MESLRYYFRASAWNKYRLFLLFLGLLFAYFFFFHNANVSGLLALYFLFLGITGNGCLAGNCHIDPADQEIEKYGKNFQP